MAKELCTQEIYVSPNNLFVVQHNQGWHLATDSEFIYEWQVSSDMGYRSTKNIGDLVNYLYYLTDPSHDYGKHLSRAR